MTLLDGKLTVDIQGKCASKCVKIISMSTMPSVVTFGTLWQGHPKKLGGFECSLEMVYKVVSRALNAVLFN
jgi:hypothetical protein